MRAGLSPSSVMVGNLAAEPAPSLPPLLRPDVAVADEDGTSDCCTLLLPAALPPAAEVRPSRPASPQMPPMLQDSEPSSFSHACSVLGQTTTTRRRMVTALLGGVE
eukprot:364163-Chlamydomonas_euryale.AAC.8